MVHPVIIAFQASAKAFDAPFLSLSLRNVKASFVDLNKSRKSNARVNGLVPCQEGMRKQALNRKWEGAPGSRKEIYYVDVQLEQCLL